MTEPTATRTVLAGVTGGAVRSALERAAAAARRIAAGAPEPGDATAMTHAWLFTGPPGSGRSEAARAFAAALLCTDPEVVGCGRCPGCRTVAAGTHADYIRVVPVARQLHVDAMRTVITEAYKRPSTAPWRVVLIEDADRLNEAAANAILKSVEEPPARTVMLFCAASTDPADFSVTLRSRCRHVYVPTPKVEDITALLMAEGAGAAGEPLTAEQARWAAVASGRHIGRARLLARDPGVRQRRDIAVALPEVVYQPDRSYRFSAQLAKAAEDEADNRWADVDVEELAALENALGVGGRGKGVQAALRGSKGQIDELVKEQKRRRKLTISDFLDLALLDVAGIYRDALVVAFDATAVTEITNPDRAGSARELARRNRPEALLACVDAVMDCRRELGGEIRPVVALDALIGRLQQLCRVG